MTRAWGAAGVLPPAMRGTARPWRSGENSACPGVLRRAPRDPRPRLTASPSRRGRQVVQSRRDRRDLGQVGEGQGDDLALHGGLDRDGADALRAERFQGEGGQDGHAEARRDEAEDGRVVVGGEVDARGEALGLADLDQLAAAAGAAA